MSHKEDDQGFKFISAKGKSAQSLYKKYGRWVQINRRKYKIQFCLDLAYENNSVLGLCDVVNKILYINLQGDIASTLVHEIGHAESFESGFKQRANWCSDNEEHFVETMGEAISLNFDLVRKS
jgi:hypothetical protein